MITLKNTFFLFVFSLTILTYQVSNAYAQIITGPAVNGTLTSPFGKRSCTGCSKFHRARDIAATAGTPIRSQINGRVVESRFQTNKSGTAGWGNTVLIESASGNYRVRYSHMQGRGPAVGSNIQSGQTVGGVGGTGRPNSSLGPYGNHSDEAIYVKGSDGKFYAVDPAVAEGKNLDDPAVREELIADAKAKGNENAEGDPQGSQDSQAGDPNNNSGSGSDGQAMIGCDPAIQKGAEAKVKALRQQETEAAKAIITKPASVQQLTCFDQYTKVNADKIGKIHSDPAQGISDTITPNVEQPAMKNILANFGSALTGGLQSMLSGALGGLFGGGAGGGDTCGAMDQMWKLMECMDFPQMPNLSDIMGGGGGDLGGMLAGLGGGAGSGGLGSLGGGGGGGGIMGAVCQALKGAMGGGGSGATEAYEDALEEASKEAEPNDVYENIEEITQTIEDVISGENSCTKETWNYPESEINRIDIRIVDGEIEADEFTLFDTDGSCDITIDEIEAYEGNINAGGQEQLQPVIN